MFNGSTFNAADFNSVNSIIVVPIVAAIAALKYVLRTQPPEVFSLMNQPPKVLPLQIKPPEIFTLRTEQ